MLIPTEITKILLRYKELREREDWYDEAIYKKISEELGMSFATIVRCVKKNTKVKRKYEVTIGSVDNSVNK